MRLLALTSPPEGVERSCHLFDLGSVSVFASLLVSLHTVALCRESHGWLGRATAKASWLRDLLGPVATRNCQKI